jgi:radical SAM superfamily enzyme YgiQ (UPF0313 family)
MTVRLLLVNPKFDESFWSFRWAVEHVLPGKRAVNPPLGLATVAALCPPHWEVEIIDENIEAVPLAPRADIVGVCGMAAQFARQSELLDYYRRGGYHTVAGGAYASLVPERYARHADTVIAGEAEHIWPAFCRDFELARPRALYRETGTVSLADSPVPRFDLLKLPRYTTATVQFSRGCPYRCEFCDIIVMFGRRPRHKSTGQIAQELDLLRARGVVNVFFVDDNLIGDRPAARALLRFLADYQRQHGYRFNFGTEASINLAQDRELLELFTAAGFVWVFIGIESPDEATLRAAGKTQNIHEAPLTALRRIYAHGLDVLAGFIVGFDGDTPATFRAQQRFILASGIQVAMVGLLTALPRTPLYERVEREGRLIADAAHGDNTRPATNIVPRHMAYDALVASYLVLYRHLTTDRAIAQRIRNKLRHLRNPVYRGEYALRERVVILSRLLARLLRGGPARLYHFACSMPWLRPRQLPLATVDWIAGLAMRDFVERRYCSARARDADVAGRGFASLTRAIRRPLDAGKVRLELTLCNAVAPRLRLSLVGALGPAFFRRIARRLERLLARSGSSVTLVVEHIEAAELVHFERMLERLARYGDRIFVKVSEQLHGAVNIDSSVFRLMLGTDHAA